MPYTPTPWNEGLAPGISAANLNNLETQYAQAMADTAILVAASGTQLSNAAPSNLSIIALTGLLITDSLLVIMRFYSDSAQNCSYLLYSVTDSVTIATLLAADAGVTGDAQTIEVYVGQRLDNNLRIVSAGVRRTAAAADINIGADILATTAWTAPWTLALRSGSGTGAGTDNWAWAVYKMR